MVEISYKKYFCNALEPAFPTIYKDGWFLSNV